MHSDSIPYRHLDSPFLQFLPSLLVLACFFLTAFRHFLFHALLTASTAHCFLPLTFSSSKEKSGRWVIRHCFIPMAQVGCRYICHDISSCISFSFSFLPALFPSLCIFVSTACLGGRMEGAGQGEAGCLTLTPHIATSYLPPSHTLHTTSTFSLSATPP